MLHGVCKNMLKFTQKVVTIMFTQSRNKTYKNSTKVVNNGKIYLIFLPNIKGHSLKYSEVFYYIILGKTYPYCNIIIV